MTAIDRTLTGFGPFLRKELGDWWRRRAAVATAAVVGGLAAVGTLATRIDEFFGGVPTAEMLNPTANVLSAQFEQWLAMASIFASLGLLTLERSSGTLAWSLSKPLSRPSLLLAKWCAASLTLALCAVVVPLAVSAGVASIAYGTPPDAGTVARYGLVLLAVPVFFAALNLAMATKVDSQGAIAAVAFAAFAGPYLLGSLLPGAADFWPTSVGLIAGAVASGAPANPATLASWAVAVVALLLTATLTFAREDL
jgi:hypothetical protein